MRRLVLGLFAMVAIVGFVAPAVAAEQKSPEEIFKKKDANGDGKLSVDEFVGKAEGEKADKAKARFAKLDKDGDGSLTLAEFEAGFKKKS
ncbi:MAG TPA: EF-hand domain-containing protein [Pirellulales bacterium]|jgi:Ca2+-binding EF-hand superfamily protein|nr:EF-hand domain-containing protein [Pirellulales bacterium]